MQITRSQSEQTAQKIAPTIFDSAPNSFRPLKKTPKFRLFLFLSAFYPFILFLTLFITVVLRHGKPTGLFIFNASAVFAATVGLMIFSFFLVNAILRERTLQRKDLARARCLTAVAEELNKMGTILREKMKQVGRRLATEGDLSGWRCRIVLKEDPFLLPPSGNLGFHIPMTVEDKTLGTLIVTAGRAPIDQIDQDFFEALAKLFASFLYKEKMWDDFHAEVERVQAIMLLNAHAAASPASSEESMTVEHMLKSLGALYGKVENSVDNKL